MLAFTPPASAGAASPWAVSAHSAARLIPAGSTRSGGGSASTRLLAGLQVRLDPTFITYWRSPGEAGVGPSFNFTGSRNLKDAEVRYPAPRKLDEGGVEAFGYEDGVTFPLVVEAQDPTRPVELSVAFDYAVCANICLPAKAKLDVVLDGSTSAEAGLVSDAASEVPSPRTLGEPGSMRIDAVRRVQGGEYVVDATTPDGSGTLLAEAPEPFFATATAARSAGEGRLSFTLHVSGPADAPAMTAPLRLTLVSSGHAIEVRVRLDAAAAKP